MPLIKSTSKKAQSKNIAEMVKAGHNQAQAVAASYRIKRQVAARKGKDGPGRPS